MELFQTVSNPLKLLVSAARLGPLSGSGRDTGKRGTVAVFASLRQRKAPGCAPRTELPRGLGTRLPRQPRRHPGETWTLRGQTTVPLSKVMQAGAAETEPGLPEGN